jgi:hypothetical protein
MCSFKQISTKKKDFQFCDKFHSLYFNRHNSIEDNVEYYYYIMYLKRMCKCIDGFKLNEFL